MQQIAWAVQPEVWNHPMVQSFLEREMHTLNPEFGKFLLWLASKPRWMPFRTEWSLYNEDLKVAGQPDSIWQNLDDNNAFIIVDWKRTHKPLTKDKAILKDQSFEKIGIPPCSHLYDAASCHYYVQQTLYAYLLEMKYDIFISKIILLQCHPIVGGATYNEVRMKADHNLAKSMAQTLLRSKKTSNQ
jgi:hypothetical protein